MVVCFFVCHRVVFRALSSLCVRRSVRECLTQHAYQETKQVTLERPISTQFKDDVLSSSQWLSVIKLQKSMTELVSLKQKKQNKRKPMTWVHVVCINVNGCIKLNKGGMLPLSLRCAPASAGQRIHRRLQQGALFSPVGLPRRPAALPQGAGVPDAEDLGRPLATAAWRGEARSSHCWRKVGGVWWKLNCAACVSCLSQRCQVCLLAHFTLSTGEVRQVKSLSDVHFKCKSILIITANIIISCLPSIAVVHAGRFQGPMYCLWTQPIRAKWALSIVARRACENTVV